MKPVRGTGFGWEPLTRAEVAVEGMVVNKDESAYESESEA